MDLIGKNIKIYKRALNLYKKLGQLFDELSSSPENADYLYKRIEQTLNEFRKYINAINLEVLKKKYNSGVIDKLKINVQSFRKSHDTISKRIKRIKYYDDLKQTVPGYVKRSNLAVGGKFAGDVKKFISNITSLDNVEQYQSELNAIGKGTMPDVSFKRIYNTLMNPVPIRAKKQDPMTWGHKEANVRAAKEFKSFKNYKKEDKAKKKQRRMENKKIIPTLEEFSKKINEDFYNPFDEDDDKKPKSKHISDKGGTLIKRQPTFNANRLEVSKRGTKYFVTARTQFARGEVVEVCPTIILGTEATAIDRLRDIVFELDKNKENWALVLGYGSLYGHSEEANLDYGYNRATKQMMFLAKQPIQLGEELTINYGKDFWTARKEFGTMASHEDAVDPTITKLMPQEIEEEVEEIEESEVQPNQADIEQRNSSKILYGEPNSQANPAVSGKAILGTGQS